MSFNDFSDYTIKFDRLDARISDPKRQNKYYLRWREKYANTFKTENKLLIAIEWDLRCKRALREIFSSATFYVEAKKNLEMRCFSSYYFCLYYALFHAMYSCAFLDTELTVNQLLEMTHSNLPNVFTSAHGNSKNDMLSRDVEELFVELRHKREYYSYFTPFNNLFDYREDLEKLEPVLLDCYQLTSFLSLIAEKSYRKNVGGITQIACSEDRLNFEALFSNMFSKQSPSGHNLLDSSCEILKGELLQHGLIPEYISLDIEHQFDEFHTYDNYYGYDSNESALNILDIWALVAKALL